MLLFAPLLALGLVRSPRAPSDDPSLFLCNSSVHGDLCSSKGLALYVAAGLSPSYPEVMYQVTHSEWSFTQDFVENTLKVTYNDQPNVSGKFSCVFTPAESGVYYFELILTHDYHDLYQCDWLIGKPPGVIEMELTDDDVERELTCVASANLSCKNPGYFTNYMNCTRRYVLTGGYAYPFYAGVAYNAGVDHAAKLKMKLTYKDPTGVTNYITEDDATVGVITPSPSPSSSLSRSPSKSPSYSPSKSVSATGNGASSVGSSTKSAVSGSAIGGVCAGLIFIMIVFAAAVWTFYKRITKARAAQSSGRSGSSSGSRKGGTSRREGSGSSSRRSKGSSSSSRRSKGSGTSSRRRKGSPASSRRAGGSEVPKSGHRSKSSGTSSRRKSGNGSDRGKGSGRTSRSKDTVSGRKVSGGFTGAASGIVSSRSRSIDSGSPSHKKSGMVDRRGVAIPTRNGAGVTIKL